MTIDSRGKRWLNFGWLHQTDGARRIRDERARATEDELDSELPEDWQARYVSSLVDAWTRKADGVVESFRSRLRDECLNREWFASVAEAQIVIEHYRQAYNTTRPHSSLGYRTPAEMRADHETPGDSDFSQRTGRKPEPVPP